MKLERVLRKAAPFLLIAILIACLFSKPQKEGMKGIDHYMKQGVDDGKDYYHSVDNVEKDYHTYESSPTHQWLKNAGSNNKYANDIHEYTIYKPADHWLNSKPGLKTTFNIYKAWQGFNVNQAWFKSDLPDSIREANRLKKFEDLPEREEIDDVGDYAGEVAKQSAETTGDTVSKQAVSGADGAAEAGENPLKTGEVIRSDNMATDEQVLRDIKSPRNFAKIVEDEPATSAEVGGTDAAEATVEAMRSRITFY